MTDKDYLTVALRNKFKENYTKKYKEMLQFIFNKLVEELKDSPIQPLHIERVLDKYNSESSYNTYRLRLCSLINEARKIMGNKIIGVTCHNSIKLAKYAVKEKASYIAFGAFFSTKTKKIKFKAKTEILNKAKKLSQTPIVAIGGININNYKKLLLNNANLLAISGYVWNNKKYKPLETIKKLK